MTLLGSENMDKKHFLFSDEQMEIADHFARLIASLVPGRR